MPFAFNFDIEGSKEGMNLERSSKDSDREKSESRGKQIVWKKAKEHFLTVRFDRLIMYVVKLLYPLMSKRYFCTSI